MKGSGWKMITEQQIIDAFNKHFRRYAESDVDNAHNKALFDFKEELLKNG